MAKQNGLVKLLGTVGDMTYYKSKDGFLAKEKTSLNGERIASDPKFKRTRENMAEFGDAGKAGKTLRQSVNLLLQNAKDARVVSRLCKAMLAIVKTDKTNKRGMRTVALGDVTLLGGFEFNANAVLNTTLYAPFTTAIDRLTGKLTVDVPAFVPSSNIIAPEGATHFQLVAAGAAIDFSMHRFTSATSLSGIMVLDETQTADITLTNTVTPGSTFPLFLVFGIQFFQLVNKDMYPLSNSSFNALSVIDINVA